MLSPKPLKELLRTRQSRGNRIGNLVPIPTPKPFILQSLTVRIPYKAMF